MPKRVLVIDDDQNTVRFLTVALQQNGYDAVGAYDGEEGLKKLQEAKPDLVVLDVMIPKRTGFTLFKQLRKHDSYKDIPVIMVTGIASVLSEFEEKKESGDSAYDPLRESVKKMIQEMRDDGLVKPEMFVDKPIDPEVLVGKVRALIGS